MAVLAFSMPDDERRRLLGGGGPPRHRKHPEGRRRGDPMDAFVWAALGVMLAVTVVYCVGMLRDPAKAAGALQGLLAVVPIITLVLTLRRDRNDR